MRGSNHQLVITTKTLTNEEDPTIPVGASRTEPLFAFPVQICKAIDDDKDSRFDNAAPSGAEYEVRYFDPATETYFPYDERLRGVRSGDDFKAIDADAIKAIDAELATKDITVLGTSDYADLPAHRVSGFYFLQSPAKGGSAKAYRLIYEALRPSRKKGDRPAQKAKAMTVKYVSRTRQKMGVIYADETRGCLALLQVVFDASVREPDSIVTKPLQAQIEDAQIEQARKLLGSIGDGAAALQAEVDDTVIAREALIAKALAGETVATPTPVAASSASGDLTDALNQSLAALAAIG